MIEYLLIILFLKCFSVDKHRSFVTERQKEIKILKECSDKHNRINRDIRMEILTDNVKKALLIKDVILPVEEEEGEELPELTDTQLKLVERAFRGDPNEVLARKFNLSITRRYVYILIFLNECTYKVLESKVKIIYAVIIYLIPFS